ncbi:MAG: hypothetical protein KF779_17045 [Hyphomonadaceae bacterium]|nr:hypothetical protein [Hyphomonadaceae bacterium]
MALRLQSVASDTGGWLSGCRGRGAKAFPDGQKATGENILASVSQEANLHVRERAEVDMVKSGRRARSLRWHLLAGALFCSPALALVAHAETGSSTRVDAAAEVATVVFQASATQLAAQRLADDNLRRANLEIERLRAQGEAARIELASAEERFVAELSVRDEAYRQEIAVYRGAVEDIASTPEGVRALARYNAGDVDGALSIVDRLADARARARRAGADLAEAVDRRNIARLALDALRRGQGETRNVIARYEDVVRLDPSNADDWLELARLDRDAHRLAEASGAVESGLRVAESDRARGLLAIERGLIAGDRGDTAGSRAAFSDARTALAARAERERTDVVAQRDYVESLYRSADVASDELEAGTLRAEALERARALVAENPGDIAARLALLSVFDSLAGDAAAREDYRTALATLGEQSDALERLSEAGLDADGGIALRRARARMAIAIAGVFSRLRLSDDELDARLSAMQIYSAISRADPTSALAREDLANAQIDYGAAALGNNITFQSDDGGDAIDGGDLVEGGLQTLRELALAEPDNHLVQIQLASRLLNAARVMFAEERYRARGDELLNEAVTLGGRLDAGGAGVEEIGPLLTFGLLARAAPFERVQDWPNAIAAYDEAIRQQQRVLAARNRDDTEDFNFLEVALLGKAEAQHASGDARASRATFAAAVMAVREAQRHARSNPAEQALVANMYKGLGLHLLRVGEAENAQDMFERGFAIQARLASADREVGVFTDDFRDDLLDVGERLGAVAGDDVRARYVEQAVDLYREAVRQQPDEVGQWERLEETLERGARIYANGADEAHALRLYRERAAALERVNALGRSRAVSLVFAYFDVADSEADESAASHALDHAVDLARSVFQNDPSQQVLLVTALGHRADWKERHGAFEVALADVDDGVTNAREAATAHRDVRFAASNLIRLALIGAKAAEGLADSTRAWGYLEQATAASRQFSAEFAQDQEMQRLAARALAMEADRAEAQGRRAALMSLEGDILAVDRRLAALQPGDSDAQLQMAQSAARFASCQGQGCAPMEMRLQALADARAALDSVRENEDVRTDVIGRVVGAFLLEAQIHHGLGDDQAARAAYQQAQVWLTTAVAAHTDDAAVQVECVRGVDYIAQSMSANLSQAEGFAVYTTLIHSRQNAVRSAPGNAAGAVGLLNASEVWAGALARVNREGDAIDALRDGLAQAMPVVVVNPDNEMLVGHVVIAQTQLANLLKETGAVEEAERAARSALDAARAFSGRAPEEARHTAMVARASYWVSNTGLAVVSHDDGVAGLIQLRQLHQALVPGSNVSDVNAMLMFELQNRAPTRRAAHDYRGAVDDLSLLKEIYVATNESGDRIESAYARAVIDTELALNLNDLEDYAHGEASAASAVEGLTHVVETVGSRDNQRALARALIAHADALILLGRSQDAGPELDRALSLFLALAAPPDGEAEDRTGRGLAYFRFAAIGRAPAAWAPPPPEVHRYLSATDLRMLALAAAANVAAPAQH